MLVAVLLVLLLWLLLLLLLPTAVVSVMLMLNSPLHLHDATDDWRVLLDVHADVMGVTRMMADHDM